MSNNSQPLTRKDLNTSLQTFGEQLHAEMKEQNKRLGRQLRSEMQGQGNQLRAEMRQQKDAIIDTMRDEIDYKFAAFKNELKSHTEEVIGLANAELLENIASIIQPLGARVSRLERLAA